VRLHDGRASLSGEFNALPTPILGVRHATHQSVILEAIHNVMHGGACHEFRSGQLRQRGRTTEMKDGEGRESRSADIL